ncbi:MAG: ABC transporter ATP-binding protein [Actinomycetaceae bacterium]|nr:ABC transporter ATP-binding protein/permease [Arcanobacterium sp.]MDD7505872.1 ABC transporter ATP-binding protein [Actinomycetaceae bacterium]MDY6143680.1 ABC transporter ATP-binding protein [Arcanobacterium sp.]
MKHRQSRVHVISPQGSKGTRITALMRIGVGVCTALAMIFVSQTLGSYISPATTAGNIDPIVWILAAVLSALAAGACGYAEVATGAAQARKEENRIRQRILKRVFASESLPKNDADAFSSARLIQMMTDNAERLTDFRQQYWGSTLAALLTPAASVAYIALAVDARLGLAMGIAIPVVPLLIGGFLTVFRGVSARSRNERAKLTTQYLDALRNLTTIRLFGAGERLERRLARQGENNRRAIMRLLAGNQIVIIVLDGAFSLVFVCWSVYAIMLGINAGRIDAPGAISAVLLLVLLLEPLNQVAGFFYVGMGGIAAQRAIKRYLGAHDSNLRATSGTAHTTEDISGLRRAFGSQPASTAPPVNPPAIEVRDLSYDYGRGQVLDNVDLRVERGTKVAIVGQSGAGKSTLLALLRGSLPMQDGHITIGSRPLSGLTPSEVRSLSATVSQSTWLFAGTVATNLRLVNPEANEAQMWHALEQAHIAEDIRRMPDGLNTEVGENGSRLSGGQAQRISLARAFLSGRELIFLDEPTSHVDIDSEQHIIEALEQIGAERTLVIVTHRPALLKIADAVFEMDGGKLTARTTRHPSSLPPVRTHQRIEVHS